MQAIKLMRERRGVALATVVIVFAMVAVIAATVCSIAISEVNSAAAAEQGTEAYYLARSAVELASKQLEDKIDALNAAHAELENAVDVNEATEALGEYNSLRNALDASGLLPASESQTGRMTIDGIADTPVTVEINLVDYNGEKWYELSSEVTVNGRTGRAAMRMTSFSSVLTEVNSVIKLLAGSFSQEYLLYSWKNMDLGSRTSFEPLTSLLSAASVGAGGTITDQKWWSIVNMLVTKKEYDKRDVPVLIPSSKYLPEEGTPALLSLPSKKKVTFFGLTISNARYFSKDNNGYYGDVTVDSDDTWTIDCSKGSVVLIFDSLTVNADLTIKTSFGNTFNSNRIYIYLTGESGSGAKSLLNITSNGNLEIRDLSWSDSMDDESVSLFVPKAYIISCPKEIRDYCKSHGTLNIPYADYVALAGSMRAYSVDVNGYANLMAYLYLPGCSLNTSLKYLLIFPDTNLTVYGAAWADSFGINGKSKIIYRPVPTQSASISALKPYYRYTFGIDKIWLR